jgi:hypothetical protein
MLTDRPELFLGTFMAILQPQATPWRPLPNREIADADGNVVQYTQANIGLMCLTANAHKKLVDTLLALEPLLADKPDAVALIREATGRLGPAVIASMIEAETEGSPALDIAIANELQIPVALYTTSIDAAMTLIPDGKQCSFKPHEDGTMVATISESFVGIHKSLPCAISSASMRARAG